MTTYLYERHFENLATAVVESARGLPCDVKETVHGLRLIATKLNQVADEIERQVRNQAPRPLPPVLPKRGADG